MREGGKGGRREGGREGRREGGREGGRERGREGGREGGKGGRGESNQFSPSIHPSFLPFPTHHEVPEQYPSSLRTSGGHLVCSSA